MDVDSASMIEAMFDDVTVAANRLETKKRN